MLKKRNLQTDNFLKMTKEEQEELLGKATRRAIAESHAMGLSTAHSDGKHLFLIHPDGRKEIIGKTEPL